MDLTQEQASEIKKQIIQQIQNTFPEDKKQESIKKIESMNPSELNTFLEKNNMVKDPKNPSPENQKCIFCSIVSQEIPSTKILENNNSIAILELNPLSEGHTIIIPKNHSNIPNKVSENLAEETKEKLKNSLNPKDVLIEHGEMFGHAIINAIPIYGDSLETERKESSPEELQKIKEKIENSSEKTQKTHEEKAEEISEEHKIIPKRIP